MCQKCESPLERKFHQAWMQHPTASKYRIEPQIIVRVQSRKVKIRRIDFGFSNIKLGVEIDSVQYHSSKQQRSNDQEREKELKREGWTLLHLNGKDVYHYPEAMANRVILQYLKKTRRNRNIISAIFDSILEWILE